MGVCSSLRGTRKSSQNRSLAWSFCSNTGVNSACNLLADGGFVDGIIVLAPQWESADHFGGQRVVSESLSRLELLLKHGNEFGLQSARRRWIRRQYHTSGSPMKVCSSLRGTRKSSQNRSLASSFCSKTGLNSVCNLLADAGFVDSNTFLAPQWGSVVHFGGPESRFTIALSL